MQAVCSLLHINKQNDGWHKIEANRKKVTHAAVGVIQQADDQVLLAERPVGKPWSGYWEFPGGKVEAGETAEQALCRELKEELGVIVTTLYPWITRTFDYPAKYEAGEIVSEAKTVKLSFFIVTQWQGEPRGLENQTLCWQSPNNMQVEPMLPANSPIFAALQLPKKAMSISLSTFHEARFLNDLIAALVDGIRMIIVQDTQYDEIKLTQMLEKIMAMVKPYAAKVMVENDVNRQIQADGQHVSAKELHTIAERNEHILIGATCHDKNDLNKAAILGLDYVVFSPTHIEVDWLEFRQAIRDYAIPTYVIGEMTERNLAHARSKGAHGLVAISK